ncbi:hypothetical protein ACFOWX_02300 [Sphingorhabdus arenilitoris]|uniref:DUF885 domain-containing protein n=1 Tax=Sphingorhabdus arenilitoris TaxID=1490041 RepID=A0ABV8RE81_9SPHN
MATLAAAYAITACAPVTKPPAQIASPVSAIDELAVQYVKLSLEIGAQEDGYIDAYYGPDEWKPVGGSPPKERAQLLAETRQLLSAVQDAATQSRNPDTLRRTRFLAGQLRAAETRLLMANGQKFSFAEEAERLFAVRPLLEPLSSYDDDLAALEKLLPGEGSLSDRIEAAQAKVTIAPDRLQPVFDRAIAECKARTEAYIDLPDGESFKMEFVTGKSWSGYNYYQGSYNSLIQINTDLPIRLSRAVDLGCHEGYPGHHALNMLLEQRLSIAKGWREFSVYPLYSPQSLIAEGSANYGIELAFPGDEKMEFERDILAPLAGIAAADAERSAKLTQLLTSLSGARLTIAQLYLDAKIGREEAIALAQKYQLLTRPRAEQSIRFTEQYRSYVINYGLGLDMVRAYIEAGGADVALRWKRMEAVISEPTLPADLAVAAN